MITDIKVLTTNASISENICSIKDAQVLYETASKILLNLYSQKVLDPSKVFIQDDIQLVLCWAIDGDEDKCAVICSVPFNKQELIVWATDEHVFETEALDPRPSKDILEFLQLNFPNPHLM